MAFKMKGSAFKLNNVATKSALKQASPMKDTGSAASNRISEQFPDKDEKQVAATTKVHNKVHTDKGNEAAHGSLKMKSPLEQSWLDTAKKYGGKAWDEGQKIAAGTGAFAKELFKDQGGGYGREKTPWSDAKKAYSEKEYELLPESEKRRIEAENETERKANAVESKEQAELRSAQSEREYQQYMKHGESHQDYEARKKTPEYQQLLKDIEKNKEHSTW